MISESAIVRAAFDNTSFVPPPRCQVVEETFRSVSNGQSFNSDFSLRLMSEVPKQGDRFIEVVPIRQNSIGAEIFVMIRNDGAPVVVHLCGGRTTRPKDFAESIELIDATIIDKLGDSCIAQKYVRLVELPSELSFLVSKIGIEEIVRLPSEQIETSIGQMSLLLRNGEPAAIDGVIPI